MKNCLKKGKQKYNIPVVVVIDNDSEHSDMKSLDHTALCSAQLRLCDKAITCRSLLGASGLDRSFTTDRSAIHTIASTSMSLGYNLTDVSLSVSTIRRERLKFRELIADDIKQIFKTDRRLVVHWDDKLIKDLYNPTKRIKG
ncbi:hypothetical protein A3Q56_06521 [Intoshia linei]|uniref:Uncharacterized protein n=1 Tax=Intoshia linei TaxID=1819745 RepID=A0A177AWK6_9BILA|nr:hypothetical protein A3Q56_06521 [Intoshia linei]